MSPPAVLRLCVLLLSGLVASAGLAQKLYRWVDDDGVVHYGDHIPPEYAKQDREILNKQGVAVGFEEGEVTDEERAAQAREKAKQEEAERRRQEQVRHDRMLLQTYVSVQDIEDLRDRRLELMSSQIKVTRLYLTNLHKRLDALEKQASKYKPYSDDADAPEVPADLAGDISRTTASISLYEQTLDRVEEEQEKLKAEFDVDIKRFKELKGG